MHVILPAAHLGLEAQAKESFQLVQTIALPNVKGRLDHMDVDVKHKRLFVAGLENGSVEVIDLQSAKWIKSVPGFQKPQGIAYVESLDKLCPSDLPIDLRQCPLAPSFEFVTTG